jgi:flagellar hook protein FlgE
MQIGLGAQVADIDVDHSQGPLAAQSDSLEIALWGDGLFILEGADGGREYTRDGHFSLNAAGELVIGNRRVLGIQADANGAIDTSDELTPLQIVLGSRVPTANGGSAELRRFSIAADGRIDGHYSDGVTRPLAQIRLARFLNPRGLAQLAGTRFAQTPASGVAMETNPGQLGAATLVSGATELSNVDIGENLVELTSAETLFRANTAVIDTAGSLFDELLSLGRPRG